MKTAIPAIPAILKVLVSQGKKQAIPKMIPKTIPTSIRNEKTGKWYRDTKIDTKIDTKSPRYLRYQKYKERPKAVSCRGVVVVFFPMDRVLSSPPVTFSRTDHFSLDP